MNKIKVIITGVTGQAGSYFAEYLLKNTNYEIYGMVRRLSVANHENLEGFKNNSRFHLFSGDLNDSHSLYKSIQEILPDYYINCAAQSFVAESWITPANTFEVDCVSIIHILEAIRKLKPSCRFINFGSSEEMGDIQYSPQDELHPPRARSVYGAAKIAARQLIKVYRESYGLYCIQPWNYNYESKRRGFEFLTRKVTKNVARIYKAKKDGANFDSCRLGNIDSKRDWSHAEDIIDGVWRMLNQERYNLNLKNIKDLNKNLKEYIFASGECHSIREFVEKSFFVAGINGKWVGSGLLEKYIDNDNNTLVEIDPQFFRPADVEILQGNSKLARIELGWTPKHTFDSLIEEMVKNDVDNYI